MFNGSSLLNKYHGIFISLILSTYIITYDTSKINMELLEGVLLELSSSTRKLLAEKFLNVYFNKV